MKKFFLVVVFFITTNHFLFSQYISEDDTTLYVNTAFNVGETLKYEVKYGLVKGGEAMMGISLFPSGTSYVYHVKAIAYTTGMAKKIAQVYDIYESYIDIQTGYPIKAIRNIRENNYKRYDEVLYYQSENYVISLNKGVFEVPANALDVLSAFYYTRRFLFDQEFSKGQTITLTTFFEGKILPIKIKFKEKDKIKTNFGKVECLKFVPIIEEDSPFKKEDDMEIWFSNDGNYVPVKIRLDASIGSIKCDLIEFENLKNPFGE